MAPEHTYLVWELLGSAGRPICTIAEEGDVPPLLREYAWVGETRRAYVRCTREVRPTWQYPPVTFAEPRPIGWGGIAISLTWRDAPEWRVEIYKKVGEVTRERDPLRLPMPVEQITNAILPLVGGSTARERAEIMKGVLHVLQGVRGKYPWLYPENVEEEDYLPPESWDMDDGGDSLPPDMDPESPEYVEVE
jgi:hypothetical protein